MKKSELTEIRIADQDAASVNRKLWSVRVLPDAPFLLGLNIFPGTLILQNQGPGTIMVDNGYTEEIKLQPSQVRVIKIRNKIEFGMIQGTSAELLFEFIPAQK
jgi:hypothetical protein